MHSDSPAAPPRCSSLPVQIEEEAGMVGPRLHPQIHASEQGAKISSRRRRRRRRRLDITKATPASLTDDDDMLREILLRLPPAPSSLTRASAVCKRWRRLVTDTRFHRQFHAHHQRPPLLGVFERKRGLGIVFTPMLDPPNRLPPGRFEIGLEGPDCYGVLDCRHGRLLIHDRGRKGFVVCNAITGQQHRVDLPQGFWWHLSQGVVLCAAGDHGHVHGGCHFSPYKVVLLSTPRTNHRPVVFVYSSETNVWGNLISTAAEFWYVGIPASLVNNALYWLSRTNRILEFDLEGQSLAVITEPPVTSDFCRADRRIIQGEDGAVGFAILSWPRSQTWQRNVNVDGVATWVPWKTIEMKNIPGLPPWTHEMKTILGYSDDIDAVFIYLDHTAHMVQLKTMQSKRLPLTDVWCHPFTSFYTPGTAINGGSNEAEMLHKHRKFV